MAEGTLGEHDIPEMRDKTCDVDNLTKITPLEYSAITFSRIFAV